jgi:NAD(P)-dependent dehydrogenase (short-subunit alcohol dehydrogenase family)
MKAVVTGAARGIGAAITDALRDAGMDVVTMDVAEGCDHRVDVARDPLPDLSDVDVCVPNAAITTTVAPAHRMTPEQWQGDIDVNLTGAFRVVQGCLPGMRERGFGRVLNVASSTVLEPNPKLMLSNSHRPGIVAAFKTLARAFAGDGITFNSLLPGRIATDRLAHLYDSLHAAHEAARDEVPAGRLGTAEEMGAAAAFLCSERAAYITGVALLVDGGMTQGV